MSFVVIADGLIAIKEEIKMLNGIFIEPTEEELAHVTGGDNENPIEDQTVPVKKKHLDERRTNEKY